MQGVKIDNFFFPSLEPAAGGIGLHMNANLTEYICFNREWAISILNGEMKLTDKFTYLGSSVSSTESDVT